MYKRLFLLLLGALMMLGCVSAQAVRPAITNAQDARALKALSVTLAKAKIHTKRHKAGSAKKQLKRASRIIRVGNGKAVVLYP